MLIPPRLSTGHAISLQRLVRQICQSRTSSCLLASLLISNAQAFDAVFSVSSLDSQEGFAITGAEAGDRLGYSLSSAGDINGDGDEDLFLNSSPADAASGVGYVLFGPFNGNHPPPPLSALDGSNGFVVTSPAAADQFAYDASGGGDINGDGVDDLVIGAHYADPGGRENAGVVYVIFGRNDGSFPASLDVSTLGASEGFRLEGDTAGDYLGNAVSVAGDVNGDERADLVINASGDDGFQNNAGATYVIYGVSQGSAGFPPSLSSLNGDNGFVIYGASAGDFAGYNLSVDGDVNGDGADDLLLGTNFPAPNGPSSGAAYVVFGPTPLTRGGMVAVSQVNLNALDGNNGFVMPGLTDNDQVGSDVAVAGDVNSDGVDDVLIGAVGVNTSGDFAGAAYVVFGRQGGGFQSTLDLGSLNGNDGFVMVGASASDFTGSVVSAAGDLNGDSIDDLLVGARGVNAPGRDQAGAAYVVYGRPTGGFPASLSLGSLGGNNDGFRIVDGVTGDSLGLSLSWVGDVSGDGLDDVLIGQPDGDRNQQQNSGTAYLIFGQVVPLFADGFE